MNSFTRSLFAVVVLGALLVGASASASHSWGSYHWARTANPFTLKLGDNVTSAWDAYLLEASTVWSTSTVLDTVVVTGATNPKNCKAVPGRVEVCNSKYGNNGWLGLAQIAVSGNHITRGVAKMNDTYFNTAKYNTPAWRRLVMCQEVAHTFGLDHQDENFDNQNLGTCMDYTSDPDGTINGWLSNTHPNAHDYSQLETIYAHLDAFTTLAAGTVSGQGKSQLSEVSVENPNEWGTVLRRDAKGNPSLFERNFGRNEKVITHVYWAE